MMEIVVGKMRRAAAWFAVAALLVCVSPWACAADVARISEARAQYETLPAAFTAAATGQTIELLGDCALDINITNNSKVIYLEGGAFSVSGKGFTLLNTGQLHVRSGNFSGMSMALDGSSTRLYVEGGDYSKVTCSTYSSARIYISGGSFDNSTLNDITHGKTDISQGVFNKCAFLSQNYDCTLTMGADGSPTGPACTDCTFESRAQFANKNPSSGNQYGYIKVYSGTYSGGKFFTTVTTGSGPKHLPTIDIYGGSFDGVFFESTCYPTDSSNMGNNSISTINVRGGSFAKSKFFGDVSTAAYNKGSTAVINVLGGTFDANCSGGALKGGSIVDAQGLLPVDDSSNPFAVGNETYATFADAVAAIPTSSAATITLLRDLYIADSQTIGIGAREITLSCGEKGIFVSNGGLFRVNAHTVGGSLTIQDGNFYNVYLSASYHEARGVSPAANIIVEGGKFEYSMILPIWSGFVEIRGGTFRDTLVEAYNYSSTWHIGQDPEKVPTFFNCDICSWSGHSGNGAQYNGEATGRIYGGKFWNCKMSCVSSASVARSHNTQFYVTGGQFFGSTILSMISQSSGSSTAKMYISGGDFKLGSMKDTGKYSNRSHTDEKSSTSGKYGNIYISGGIHGVAPDEFIASGYSKYEWDDGRSIVSASGSAARIGKVFYPAFADAMAAHVAGDSLWLYEDVDSGSYAISAGDSLALRAAGRTVAAPFAVRGSLTLLGGTYTGAFSVYGVGRLVTDFDPDGVLTFTKRCRVAEGDDGMFTATAVPGLVIFMN